MSCDGTGKLPCPACEGRGYHASPYIAPDLFTIYDCGNCKGTGRAECPTCEGCGTVIYNAGVLSRGPIRVEDCPDCTPRGRNDERPQT